MEEKNSYIPFLNLIDVPCFCVRDGIILGRNSLAANMVPEEGAPVKPLILSGRKEYDELEDGTLFLLLNINDQRMGASVTHIDDADYFKLIPNSTAELRTLSLAARELRKPLSDMLISTERLAGAENPEDIAALRRNIAREYRLVANMSDADRGIPVGRKELFDAAEYFRELFAKAGVFCTSADRILESEISVDRLYTSADRQLLERAFLNMLSNAIKYSPAGSTIHASLSRRGRTLLMSVRDHGNGIPVDVLKNIFHRYLRSPNLEEGQQGIGLGMAAICAAASCHEGTVLIDQPESGGTRVTVTIPINQNGSGLLSPVFRVDYSGEIDRMLVELSEVLPLSYYSLE